jgi:hypothetical protein
MQCSHLRRARPCMARLRRRLAPCSPRRSAWKRCAAIRGGRASRAPSSARRGLSSWRSSSARLASPSTPPCAGIRGGDGRGPRSRARARRRGDHRARRGDGSGAQHGWPEEADSRPMTAARRACSVMRALRTARSRARLRASHHKRPTIGQHPSRRVSCHSYSRIVSRPGTHARGQMI